MANRTFLIQASTALPFRYDETWPDVLLAADNCVPVYWYSLFDSGCFIPNETPLHDGRVFTYPCLVTSTEEGRARCLRRRNILERLTPESCKSVLSDWFTFLGTVDSRYLHLNTAEFCMLAEGYYEHLSSSVQAFDWPPAASTFAGDAAWLEMLDMAQIDANDLAGTVTPSKLAGYSWNRQVPWSR